MVKIFITDDHYMIVEGIRSLLQYEKGMEWMGHAMNAASCLAFLQQQQPDVILMDINLPDKSGIDLCKEVKAKYPSIHILGLSSFNQQSFIQKMMANGASGYVLKNATREELIEGIETVMQGQKFLSGEAASTMKKNEDSKALKELIANLTAAGKKSIVPMVENATMMATLWQSGAHFIQGHYLQAPTPNMNFQFGDET